jgi:methylated-DNA-protein-cysteine methyltransferase-like protein
VVASAGRKRTAREGTTRTASRSGRATRPAAASSAAAPSASLQAALERIWATVAAIPRGRVTTYGGVASAAGLPRRARLVGYALKHAPDDRPLPWHRVVGAGGRIAFPPGSRAHAEQRRRLVAEGHVVERGRVHVPRADDLDALVWGPRR